MYYKFFKLCIFIILSIIQVNKSRVSNLCKKALSPDNKKDEEIKAKKENDEKIKKAILKMKKLDKILLEKLKKEREVCFKFDGI